jgi:hypothetical protein
LSTAVAHGSHPTIHRSAAHAVARASNLRQSDLPTFRAQPNGTPSSGNAALVRCYGGVPYRDVLADVYSRVLIGRGSMPLVIESETEIFPSPTLSSRDLRALRRPRGRSCLVADYRGLFAQGLQIDEQVASLPGWAARRIPLAIRMVFRVHGSAASPATRAAYVDHFVFVTGKSEVAADLIHTRSPPPSSIEEHVMAVLAARANRATN